jgi:hypothetical protein
MIKIVTEKLMATVLDVVDLGGLYPAIACFQNRVGLDIRIEQGSLTIGKKVRLSSPAADDEVEVIGIEMLSNLQDPNVARVICSRPKALAIPVGKVEGWHIAEQ